MDKRDFKKNTKLEDYLVRLGGALAPAEQVILANKVQVDSPHPTVIKIGSPRVGGTLLTQWAASGNAFFNPTNFLSRFYQTPVIGTLINQMLADQNLDYCNEFSDIKRDVEFASEIGKTSGLLAPHEFWYFWRNFLHLPDVPSSDEAFLTHSNFTSFAKSLKGMQAIAKRSLFLKGHLINFYLESFFSKVPDVFFFYLKRNIRDTARSLYKARIAWTGSEENWFSHKPRQFDLLKQLDPVKQVVGQVYFIEKEIQSKLSFLDKFCFITSYDELCQSPAETYRDLVTRISSVFGVELDTLYTGPKVFLPVQYCETDLDEKIDSAIKYFSDNYGSLIQE
jgi:hypothetical protein